MYDIGIVGYGVATLSLLLVLSQQSIPLRVVIFDPYFDGGNLHRHYCSVRSNTTWRQFLETVEKYCSPILLQNLRSLNNPDEVTTLKVLVRNFLKVVKSSVAASNLQICLISREVKTIRECEVGWDFENGLANAKTLILNYGSKPRSLGYAKPILQLDSVLNGSDLPCLPGEKVMVFGTAHSGTLCLDRLHSLNLDVIAVHNGHNPFKFARDGFYDGIKQDSALIADRLRDKIKFISSSDEDSVRAELLRADWVLYACGFNRANEHLKIFNKENGEIDVNKYNSETGLIENGRNIFGFGIAYPNSNIVNGRTYFDVSLPSFMQHIEKNIDLILKSL
jgi:hypothetical protein